MSETPTSHPAPTPPTSTEEKTSVTSKILVGIGLCVLSVMATLAYGYVYQGRRKSAETTLVADACQIASSAQQYFLTSGKTAFTFSYDPATGALSGDITPWLTTISKGHVLSDLPIEKDREEAFSLSHPGAFGGEKVWFSDEAKTKAKIYPGLFQTPE
jgi:hypothetical protein